MFRDECLNENWFLGLAGARAIALKACARTRTNKDHTVLSAISLHIRMVFGRQIASIWPGNAKLKCALTAKLIRIRNLTAYAHENGRPGALKMAA
jgi:hypothetical protein